MMSKSSDEGGEAGGGNGSSNQETGTGTNGEKDNGDSIYENRAGTKKIIRVVTVMAYVFSVSFAAILLSAYYVFLWEAPNPRMIRHPLTSDPQAEYLMEDKATISREEEDDESIKRSLTNDKALRDIEIFRQNLTSIDAAEDKLESMKSQKRTFEYKDLVETYDKSALQSDDRGESKGSDDLLSREKIIRQAIPKKASDVNETHESVPTQPGRFISLGKMRKFKLTRENDEKTSKKEEEEKRKTNSTTSATTIGIDATASETLSTTAISSIEISESDAETEDTFNASLRKDDTPGDIVDATIIPEVQIYPANDIEGDFIERETNEKER